MLSGNPRLQPRVGWSLGFSLHILGFGGLQGQGLGFSSQIAITMTAKPQTKVDDQDTFGSPGLRV